MQDFLLADRLESGVVESTRHCILAQTLRQTQIRERANAAAQVMVIAFLPSHKQRAKLSL